MKTRDIILFCSILLLPIGLYTIHFWNGNLSDINQDWGNFGDYLNGFFTPLIALVGVVVTYKLGIISDKRNETNINIEKLKHRPLLNISYYDGEDNLTISIKNKGNGPLIIKDYKLVNLIDNSEIIRLFDCLPELNNDDCYSNYTGNINNIVLKNDEEFELFSYSSVDKNFDCEENKTAIRQALKNYKINIRYNDVYNDEMPLAERSLEWFGRNL